MKKIDRPDCTSLNIDDMHVIQGWLNAWFDEHLKDKYVVDLKDAVRVSGKYSGYGDPFEFQSNASDGPYDKTATHQAYLIGIEPIQKDSPEKVLRDLVDPRAGDPKTFNKIIMRAKALLEDRE